VYAENISAESAVAIQALPDDTAWICIHDEYDQPHPVTTATHMLQLTFSDVRAVTPHKGKIYHPMSIEDCRKILGFVKLNRNKKFIVNCNAGRSRSAAICLFIHKAFGHHLKPDFWATSEPNPFVLGTLTIEHEKSGI